MVKLKISEPNTKTHIIKQDSHSYAMEISSEVVLPLKHNGVLSLTPSDTVFSFEYKSDGELWQAVLSVSKEQSVSISNIPLSERWTSISINVPDIVTCFRDIAYLSNMSLFLSLIPLPTSPAVFFQIRNIRIRPADRAEARLEQKRKDYASRQKIDHHPHSTLWPCHIKDITSSANTITVSGTVSNCSIPYVLCEMPVWADFPEVTICPVSAEPDGKFSLTFPRIEKHDRVHSRFVVAVSVDGELSVASNPRYVDSIQAEVAIQEPLPKNKKGLGNFSTDRCVSDLDDLQISYITVNFIINDFLRIERKNRKDIAFTYEGTTYYADYEAVSRYDTKLSAAKARDIIVCAIILVRPANASVDKEVGIMLEYPEYNPAGKYSMPDLTSEESVHLYSENPEPLYLGL